MEVSVATATRLSEHLAAVRYLSVAGLTVLIYDTCITLGDESRYVWRSTGNIAKWAHLSNKYLGIIFLTLINLQLSALTGIHFSDEFCRCWTGAGVAFGFISLFISNVLVLLRVTVVWDNRRTIIGCMLLILTVTNIGGIASLSAGLAKLLHFVTFNPDVGICTISLTAPTRLIGFVWGLPLIFDLAAVALTVLNSLHRPRGNNVRILSGLREDGFFFFSGLALVRMFNLLTVTISPPSLVFLGGYFCWAIVVTFLSRFLIHLRKKQIHVREYPDGHGYDSADEDDDDATRAEYRLDDLTSAAPRKGMPLQESPASTRTSTVSTHKYS